MMKVASEYKVDGELALDGDVLIFYLEGKLGHKQYRDGIAEMYPKVHCVLKPYLKDNEIVVERMVEILMAYKFEKFKQEPREAYTTYISPIYHTDRSPVILQFQRVIGKYISEGGTFAMELVNALEYTLEKSLQNPMWSMQCYDVNPLAGPHFTTHPSPFPVDGSEEPDNWID